MIHEVTDSLEAFLKQPGLPPPLGNAAIRFDRPTDPYSLDQPTVNLFLFEVREHVELRFTESEVRRIGTQTFLDPPPFRAACTYLVTAWPVDGTDLPKQEHRLLSQVLQLFAGNPTIPPTFRTPNLQLQEPPPPMVLLQPDGVRNPAEFWAAIGNRIRPSLLLTVTVSLPVFATQPQPSVTTSEIRLQRRADGVALEAPFFRIGGRVTDAANQPVVNAGVQVLGRGRSTLTDAEGRFTLSALPAGAVTLRVTAGLVTQDKPITVPAPAANHYDVQLP
jgi:hypothetical protein